MCSGGAVRGEVAHPVVRIGTRVPAQLLEGRRVVNLSCVLQRQGLRAKPLLEARNPVVCMDATA